jgi:hypothetical protein
MPNGRESSYSMAAEWICSIMGATENARTFHHAGCSYHPNMNCQPFLYFKKGDIRMVMKLEAFVARERLAKNEVSAIPLGKHTWA